MTSEPSEDSWWRQLIAGTLLIEVVFVIGFAVVADVVVLMVERPPVRAVFGLPLLLFFPGYAVLTVLFPTRPPRSRYNAFDPLSRSVNGVERMALSFGLSLALIPLVALVFWSVDDRGFGVRALLAALTAIIVLGMMYGMYRRLQFPTQQRYRVPIDRSVTLLTGGFGFSGGVFGTVLSVGLVLSVVLATGTLGYAVLVPNQSATYTGVSLLTRGSTGELTAAHYSSAIESGNDLILSIDNHERTAVSYTVVVRIQRVAVDGDRTTVRSSSELKRLRTTVAAGKTNYVTHTVSPPMNGNRENIRLQYLVYKGDPPAVPTAANAYRTLFVWIDTGTSTNAAAVSERTNAITAGTLTRSVIG